jgi:hypothetical protein
MPNAGLRNRIFDLMNLIALPRIVSDEEDKLRLTLTEDLLSVGPHFLRNTADSPGFSNYQVYCQTALKI